MPTACSTRKLCEHPLITAPSPQSSPGVDVVTAIQKKDISRREVSGGLAYQAGMVFLHSHGVGTARAVRIYKTYGGDAVQVMSENPYRLARDIRGIGFKTADAIAMKLGIDKTAMVRVRAGISYALTEAMDEGHCGLPSDELVPLAEKLLEVPQELSAREAG